PGPQPCTWSRSRALRRSAAPATASPPARRVARSLPAAALGPSRGHSTVSQAVCSPDVSKLLDYRLACMCAVAALALAYASPTAVFAAAPASEGNAFNELAEGGKEEESTLKKTTGTGTGATGSTSSSSGSSTSTVLVVGLGAAVLLLGGIAYVIL